MATGYWTTETYRLDEVTNKFSPPCVVCFSEGFMDATESESISKDDVIKIDKRVKLKKIAAEFVNRVKEAGPTHADIQDIDDPYDKLTEEILIPLNYAGTVKVLHSETICNSVFQLKRVFPRYATVLSNIVVKDEKGQQITLQAGTRIELDRIIPGHQDKPDNLVLSWLQNGREVIVTVPVTNQGRFKTLPDETEYTLNEAIDRYGFPVVVSFVDDEIRRIYTMDLEEGIDNMKLISATLRLKRLEFQDAIIGHYKPLEDEPDQKAGSEYFARRSLVVLPLNNYDIRDIQVHVLQGTDEEIYDDIFLVSNKSHELNDVLDGTLYVDFSRKAGPRRIKKKKKKDKGVQKPPPIPPKPASFKEEKTGLKLTSPTKKKEKRRTNDYFNFTQPTKDVQLDNDEYLNLTSKKSDARYKAKAKLPEPIEDFDEDYEEITPKPLDQVSPISPMTPVSHVSPLAEMDFDKYGELLTKEGKWKKIKRKVAGGVKDIKQAAEGLTKGKYTPWDIPRPETTPPIQEEGVLYDYPDTEELMELRLQARNMAVSKPVAHIAPQSSSESTAHVKPFSNLSKSELEQRLVRCGMAKFAAVCRNSELDGKFFDTISKDVLKKEPFMLSAFDLIKLDRIKQNWIPS